MADWLLEYTRSVREGKVAAGAELRALLDRLEADRSDPRYIFGTARADKAISFIEGCVRLTKSPYYGRPMRLLPWMKAFITAVYGFRMAATGRLRFQKALLLIARKNAKTELCAALALEALINGPPGSDIACSGNDDNDASIVRDRINTMRLFLDPGEVDTSKNVRFITNRVNGSSVMKLTEKTKSKEGQSIDLAIVDEVHGMRSGAIVQSIEQSMSLKDDPLLILITSEGFVNGGYLDQELEYARRIIAGEADDEDAERYLPWLYTQDSEAEVWQDEASWEKSNPSIGEIKPHSYMRRRLARARASKADRAYTLCKDFNVKQNAANAWLAAEDYANSATFDPEDFRGAVCIGAADLSETTDLTCAMALLMRPGDDTRYVLARYWMPQAKLKDSPDTESGADYRAWAESGWIEVADGSDIDLAAVADWFYSLHRDYGLRPFVVGYDQRFARPFRNRLGDYGIEHEMVWQDARTMSNPVRLMEAELAGGRVNFQDNPVTRWCLSNAALKVNDQGMAMITKPAGAAGKRVDGAVAMAILFEMYRRHRPEFMAALE